MLFRSGTAVPLDELPDPVGAPLKKWAADYAPIHAVAHWDERKRKRSGNYDRAFEDAAVSAEKLLAQLARDIAPGLLENYPAVIWEDQDECLEVRPEDIQL